MLIGWPGKINVLLGAVKVDQNDYFTTSCIYPPACFHTCRRLHYRLYACLPCYPLEKGFLANLIQVCTDKSNGTLPIIMSGDGRSTIQPAIALTVFCQHLGSFHIVNS